jgi:serine/threonine-protein kinase
VAGSSEAAGEQEAAQVRAQLERVLASATFRDAARPSRLLRYLVEETLAGRGQGLKEMTLGLEVFDRGPDFDPRTDPVARVEASRLRTRLEQYYLQPDTAGELRIGLPRGGYVPTFARQTVPVAPVPARPFRPVLIAVALGVVLFAAGATLLPRTREPASSAPPLRVEIGTGAPGVELASDVGPDLALDATGRRLVFTGRVPGEPPRLFVRELGELRARELPGTRGARVPALSPDGTWVAYWADGSLKRSRTDGSGQPHALLATADLFGVSWNEEDTLLVALTPYELTRVDVATGAATVVSRSPPGQRRIWPQRIGADHVLVAQEAGESNATGIELLELATGRATTLVRGGTFPRHVGGQLFYASGGTLFAAPFDGRRLTGEPVALARDIAWTPTFGIAQYAVAANGTLLYRHGAGDARLTVAWLDAAGHVEPLRMPVGNYLWPRLSPDGRQLAITLREGDEYEAWVHDVVTGRAQRLAGGAGNLQSPTWTPDGERLILGSRQGLTWAAVDGSGSGVLLPPGERTLISVPRSITADGRALAFHGRSWNGSFDLWLAPLEPGAKAIVAGAPDVLRDTTAFETYPTFSPDGRWIAYGSNEGGTWEVYVRAHPYDGRQVQVSLSGGRVPTWARDGRTLVFSTDDRRLMAVEYAVRGGRFEAGAPRAWTTRRLGDTGVFANYDLAPDGRRVVALIGDEAQEGASGLVLVDDFRKLLAASH